MPELREYACSGLLEAAMATGLANPPTTLGEAREASGERLIRQQLGRAGTYVKWVELGSQLLTLIVATLLFFLAAALVDHWLFSLGTFGRWFLLLALIGGWGWFVATRMLPLLIRAVNPTYAAWAIEEATPTLKNSLVNFLLLKQDKTAVKESVLHALEQRAASDIAGIEVDSTIDRAPLIRVGYVLCGVLAVVALYKIASPKDPFQTVARVVAPWADLARPSRVIIREVQPGHTSVYLGSIVEVTADVQGVRKGDEVQLVYSTADGQVQDRAIPMKANAGGRTFVATLPAGDDGGPAAQGNSSGLQQGVQYHIAAGDALSSIYEIRVRMKPTIAVERAELVFPAYTQKPSQSQDSGEIKALEGTRVTIHARANQPIKNAFLELDPRPGRAGETIPLAVEGQTASGSFTLLLKADRVTPWRETYQVRFVNELGELSELPVLHKLEVIPDLPPEVEILAPQQSRVDLPEDSRLTLEARGIDPDFALAELSLVGKSAEKDVFKKSLLPPGEPRSQGSGKFEFVPAQFELKAGDVLKVQGHAADNRRDPATGQPQPGRAQTSEVTIQIVPARKPNPNERPNNNPNAIPPQEQNPQATPQNKLPMPGENPPKPEQPKPGEKPNEQQNPNQQPKPGENNQGNQQNGNNSNQNNASQNESGQGQGGQSGKPQQGQGNTGQENKPQESDMPPMPGQNPNNGGSGQQGTGQNQKGQGQNASDPMGGGEQKTGQPKNAQNQGSDSREPGSPDGSNQDPNNQGNPAGNPGEQTGNPGGENAQPGGNPKSGNPGGKPEHDGQKFEELIKHLKEEADKKKNQSGQGNNLPGQTAPNENPSGQAQNQPGSNNQNSGQQNQGQNSQPGGKPQPAQPGAGKPNESKEPTAEDLKNIQKMLEEERKKNGQPPMPGSQGNETAQNNPMHQPDPNGQPNGAGQRGNPQQPMTGEQPMPSEQQQPGSTAKPMGGQPMNDPVGNNQTGTPQNAAGQKPGEENKTGSPQGPPRTDEGQQAKPGEGEQKKPGAGQTGDPGAGSQSQEKTGSATGQEQNRDQPKEMNPGNSDSKSGSPSPPSASKKQSDSEGGESGNESGGGKQGAGQPGGKGNDTGGKNNPGDEGSGAANEQGKGETGSKGGKGQEAAGKTGQSGNKPGEGSSTRPDQAGNERGKTGEKQKNPGDPRGKPSGDKEDGEGKPGAPTTGGQPGDRSGAGITEKSEDVADEANLNYARKVTDLVLQHLRDQEHNPDPELAKKMQLTPQELQEFARRWSQLKEEAAKDPNRARELDEALRSLGIKDPNNRRRAGAGASDKIRDLRDSGSRTQAPSKYREQFDQFRKSAGK